MKEWWQSTGRKMKENTHTCKLYNVHFHTYDDRKIRSIITFLFGSSVLWLRTVWINIVQYLHGNNPVSICMALNLPYIFVRYVMCFCCYHCCWLYIQCFQYTCTMQYVVCSVQNGSSAKQNTEKSERVFKRVICDSFPVNCRSNAMSKYFH